MKWKIECQTCSKAKRFDDWGIVFPCEDDECKPEGFHNTATTSTSSIPTKISNKIEDVLKEVEK